jgi:hypothetical protein
MRRALHGRSLPLTLHAGVLLATLLFLALPSPPPAARGPSGLYFLLVLVPALQLGVGTFLGWRASLVAGLAVAGLTGAQSLLPPRPAATQPVRWSVAFASPEQALVARLTPPPGSRAPSIVAAGGTATLHVCRHQGPVDDLLFDLQGAALAEVTARPTQWSCWLQLAVPAAILPTPAAPLEVTVRPDPRRWDSGAPRPTLDGGHTRPPASGGRSSGARFFDGVSWQADDLSPTDPGPQTGRYYVELRVADAAGRVREVWY